MRINEPVTQQNYAFPPGQTLVSVTDTKGRITYCNPAFVQVSGYAAHELLGQPHNMVRHPDMPEEAFRDMWQTIQAGLPWLGLVKNRRKNGDHYWVQANATPMKDGNTVTGFLSVRTAPSSAAVASAETLYALMRQEKKNGVQVHTLQQGQVVRTDLVGRLMKLFAPGMRGKLWGVQLLAAACIVGASALQLPLGVTAAVGLLGAVLALWVTSRLLTEPLKGLVRDANQLASGDLAHPIAQGEDGLIGQVQQALNQVSVNLRTVVGDVRQEVQELSNTVREIAEGNLDMSSRTESQASSLEQTAASMEEINGTVQLSAASAIRGAQLATETAEITQRSNDAVNSVAETMRGISASSAQMSDIIQLIEGVAFQTNILALNAAVEAARAGEQGRGFAVVAAEVRALAQRSAGAARDIKQLITDSSGRIDTGSEQTSRALERMQAALHAVGQVSTVLTQISLSASEQQLGISQVNEAVTHMDTMTQQNAAMVEQLAATAQALRGQVEGVSNSMRLFRLAQGELTLSQMDAVSLRRDNQAQGDH